MRALDLKNKKIVIWGTGREGVAALRFVRRFLPEQPVIFVDESAGADTVALNAPVIHDPDGIAAALNSADIVIKSPGVSLYHPLLAPLKARGVPVTSLLNLWFAEPRSGQTICVTGTKGKSTTASLIAHVLRGLGKTAEVLGNIGKPITETDTSTLDTIVIETSSYQAATFDGLCDVAVLTSLYPEHLDWHQNLDRYYRDKLNLLGHARVPVINAEALPTIRGVKLDFPNAILVNHSAGFHIKDHVIYDGDQRIGILANNHLARHHNSVNACAVLAVVKNLGLNVNHALQSMENFQGLPHRQQELGTKNNILYVDDSISTTPQSAIAAMEAYPNRPIALIAGGHDRGIDYTLLVEYVRQHSLAAVACMGSSGARIAAALRDQGYDRVVEVSTMAEAIRHARHHTPNGGVILLSPAAPSYGLFKNFEERGRVFAAESGF